MLNLIQKKSSQVVYLHLIVLKVYLIQIPTFLDNRPPPMRLECLRTYELFGNIMSLQSVSLTNAPRDALLISFQDAKLSVVQHDPDTFDLKTLSLHYFEEGKHQF